MRRGRARVAAGGALVITIALLICALSLAQATEEAPAKRALAREVAILSEVDTLLDDNYASLREEASAAPLNDRVMLAGFPIAVPFAPDEVLQTDREAFRSLLLGRAASHLYEEGSTVLETDGATSHDIFSTQGAVRSSLDLFRERPHDAASLTTGVLAGVAAVLLLTLILTSRTSGALLSVGLGITIGAFPAFISALAVRYAFRVVGDGSEDYLTRQFFLLGEDLAWAPVRNGAIFAASGFALLGLGAFLSFWGGHGRSRRDTLPAS